jgi:hypothetical protein
MDAKTLKALKGSIRKWERIIDGKGIEDGNENCPLCKLFYWTVDCRGCPVSKKTKINCCSKTPYDEWHDHQTDKHNKFEELKIRCETCKKLAQKELDFLKSLLSKKVKK